MLWEFATAGRIIFGAGSIKSLPDAAKPLGKRALLVTGSKPERFAGFVQSMETVPLAVQGEPTVDLVRSGAARFRSERCDYVIALGGGSSIDAAKGIAAVATNSGEPLDYLEVVGRGLTLEKLPAPVIAIPTTAGTGSKVTRNAVLGSPEHGVKASLRHVGMLPRVAIVDPELTYELPSAVTASTGMDALTQVIEPYVSRRAHELTDLFCKEGMARVTRSLRVAYENGHNARARADMSFAALMGGLSLASAGLGVVHGFAAPIGGMFPKAPHGAVCAALLPHGVAANVSALRSRAPGHAALGRYCQVAMILTGNADARVESGVAALSSFCSDLSIPPLRSYGMTQDHIPELCRKAAQASSMKANPIELTEDELEQVLRAAL